MVNLPTTFATEPEVLDGGLGDEGDLALRELKSRGYVVLAGLSKDHAKDIGKMAKQPHIREYCPNDCSSYRFADEQSTKKWLAAGRAVFILAKQQAGKLEPVGYGWAGRKKTDEVPGGETTFALRIGQAGLGQGLSEPFSIILLAAATKLYGADKIWLETWASNEGAVHVYKKLGFKLVKQKNGHRPTLSGEKVDDSRMFMARF